MSELIQSIGYLKYLNKFTLKSMTCHAKFTEEDMQSLLKNNIFLSDFNIHYHTLPANVLFFYRLIRQRKRIHETQMLAIEAMEHH